MKIREKAKKNEAMKEFVCWDSLLHIKKCKKCTDFVKRMKSV